MTNNIIYEKRMITQIIMKIKKIVSCICYKNLSIGELETNKYIGKYCNMKRFNKFVVGTLSAMLLMASVPVKAEEVLVVTWRGKTDAEKGFEDKLKQLRPSVKFQYIDAKRNKGELAKQLRGYDFSKVNLVYSFGTTGTKMTKKALGGQVPHVFNIVSAPVKSKIVASFDKPGGNITGVRHIVDVKTQYEIMKKIKDIKTIGVWFDPREKNTVALKDTLTEIAKKDGKTVKGIRVIPDAPNFLDMVDAASKEAKTVDVLYVPSSSGYIAKAKELFSKLDKSVVVFGAINKFVGKGATVSLAASYSERGSAAAELANEILGGKKAGNLPVNVVTSATARLYVDKKHASVSKLKDLSKLGIDVVEK